ncbi:hypothetical protein LS684_21305 (plasmid) [Cytobacillus spongiae]|uniref:hypothetical protein n=1 Tax=Cytobacillus spongiae TaxID=2901381 RepID=UPI001F31C53D|nr:hypothetical protein [Cytobacillus spongiae]UII58160.1 hypothetical protein LS684_21305 [Cytobacillus spongiae]
MKGYKPTSFRFPQSIIGKIEELAKEKKGELGFHKMITKSDMVTILVNQAYDQLLKDKSNKKVK